MGIGYLAQQFRFDPAGWRFSNADVWRGAPANWEVSGVVSGASPRSPLRFGGELELSLDMEMGCDVTYQPSTRKREPLQNIL